jgi:hypothetical protein
MAHDEEREKPFRSHCDASDSAQGLVDLREDGYHHEAVYIKHDPFITYVLYG